MKDQEIRIAIAECCGWQRRYSIDEHDKTIHWHLYDSKGNCIASGLPNYPEDLNAMHDAWANCIGANDSERFNEELWQIIARDHHDATEQERKWFWVNATARQRAEAFLRTLNKWKD